MLRFADVSKYQYGEANPFTLGNQVDGFMIKATDGVTEVDAYCDAVMQKCITAGVPRGFYHEMTSATGTAQAEFFYTNCENYFHDAVPALAIEGMNGYPNDPERAYDFCNAIIKWTGVPPLVYMNGSCLDSADYSKVVALGCGLWIANYPAGSKGFDWAEQNTSRMWGSGEWPFAAMWQFTSTGRLEGCGRDLDLDLFFGDVAAWNSYAGVGGYNNGPSGSTVLENDKYRVTIEEK